jgi:acyl-CoA thioesterase-1
MQIPPNYGRRYTEPFFSQYSELAAENDLPLIPFLIDGIPQQPELMQDDGIHPRAEAQGIILENVWPVLLPLLDP